MISGSPRPPWHGAQRSSPATRTSLASPDSPSKIGPRNEPPRIMPHVHPTAVLGRRATRADDVRVGPVVVIAGPVEVGARRVIDSHCVLKGSARIGPDCEIGPAAHVGTDPQLLSYDRSLETWLVVGDRCVIRESASS